VAESHTVLIIEDNEDLRHIYATTLSMAGFRVRQAGDGLTALQYLDSEPPPDLIVLDLFLPHVSGFLVHQDIAARAELQHVPVLVVTAATPEQTRHLKVTCLLRKPVLPNDLVTAARRCMADSAS